MGWGGGGGGGGGGGWGGGVVAVLYICLLQGPGHAACYNPAAHVYTVYTMLISILTLTSNNLKKKKKKKREQNRTHRRLTVQAALSTSSE